MHVLVLNRVLSDGGDEENVLEHQVPEVSFVVP